MRPPRRLSLVLALALGCAPIETQVSHTEQPRAGPTLQLGEQLVAREHVAEFVQLGPSVLVELEQLRMCSDARHRPIMRIDEVERSANNFIIWDFVIGGFTGGFSALAFAYPRPFSRRLYGSEGQLVYDQTPAWLVGGVFAGISVIFLAAGIVNSIKARDETRYAEAYRVELAERAPCSDASELPVAEQDVELIVGDDEELIVEGKTDAGGRVRFSLPPAWPEGLPAPAGPFVRAQLAVADERVLEFELRVPWTGMVEAHTGRVDSRAGPIEGPRVLDDSAPPGFGGRPGNR